MDTAGNNRRFAGIIEYNGTEFDGWQFQPIGRTVQSELANAITVSTGENPKMNAAGRTDAGVHAEYQVVSFELSGSYDLRKLYRSLNGLLPKDVAVKNLFAVSPDFHARYSAYERSYKYLISNEPQLSPFAVDRAMWVRHPLSLDFFRKTGEFLFGEHDFAAFCKTKSSHKNTIRKITGFSVTQEGRFICVRVSANGFLHNMIRIIIGTAVQLQKEGKSPEIIKSLLDGKMRSYCGPTADACGLYFSEVKYNPPIDEFPSAV